jgi:predicted transport protein
MSDSIKKAIANQMKNLEDKTGKKLDEWKAIVNNSGLSKHGEIVTMLKEKYGLGHGYANMLVHESKQSSSMAVENQDELVTEQYKGKEEMKKWYDMIIEKIQALGDDVELSPKKAYVSVRRKKQFAIIQPSTKTRMDIGLNIKNVPVEGKLEAAGSWNTMCTHRIKVESEKDINKDVFSWIKQAYEQAG